MEEKMERKKISDIFTKSRELRIPFFQRNYVWGKDSDGRYDTRNWDRLLNDIISINNSDNNKSHFTGVLILKDLPTGTGEVDSIRQLVDGQQRITTIILFFKALCELNNINQKFKQYFFNANDKIILQHNHLDKEIFEKIVNDELDDKVEEKYKDSLILQCYKYFKNNKELSKIEFSKVISKIEFVIIDIKKEENEQEIFDSINSLGVDLTPSQLLKNYIFTENDLEFYEKTWKKTFEDENNSNYWNDFIVDNRMNLDYLLYSFLVITKSQYNNTDSNYIKIGDLFNQYKEYLEKEGILSNINNKQKFINELIEYAEIYKENIGKDLKDVEPYVKRINIIIFNLEVSPLIPYILYILKNSQEQENIMQYIEKYIIRQNICGVSTKNYNNIFIDLIKKSINTYSTIKEYFTNKDGQDLISNDEMILNNINKTFNNKDAKVILYLLEMYLRNERKDIEILKNISEFDLEHIMPKKWLDHWNYNLPKNNGKTEEENKQERNSSIYKLGNLTILTDSLNREIKHADWKTKRDGKYNSKGKRIHGLKDYANNLRVFSIYDNNKKEIEDWNEKTINDRTKWLFDQILNIWKI